MRIDLCHYLHKLSKKTFKVVIIIITFVDQKEQTFTIKMMLVLLFIKHNSSRNQVSDEKTPLFSRCAKPKQHHFTLIMFFFYDTKNSCLGNQKTNIQVCRSIDNRLIVE